MQEYVLGANTSFISLRAARQCRRALEHAENWTTQKVKICLPAVYAPSSDCAEASISYTTFNYSYPPYALCKPQTELKHGLCSTFGSLEAANYLLPGTGVYQSQL